MTDALTIATEAVIWHGSLQKPDELAALVDFLAARPIRRVLEVGSHLGGTLWAIARVIDPRATIVSIDIDPDKRPLPPVLDTQTWHRLVADSQDPRITQTIASVAGDEPFEFVFIDAEHREAWVQHDWETFLPLAAPGGVIGFHDICEHDIVTNPAGADCDVHKVWARIKADGYHVHEIKTSPKDGEPGAWGGIGLVLV